MKRTLIAIALVTTALVGVSVSDTAEASNKHTSTVRECDEPPANAGVCQAYPLQVGHACTVPKRWKVRMWGRVIASNDFVGVLIDYSSTGWWVNTQPHDQYVYGDVDEGPVVIVANTGWQLISNNYKLPLGQDLREVNGYVDQVGFGWHDSITNFRLKIVARCI